MPMLPNPSDEVVKYLRSLGWSEDEIAKMGRGPSFHSGDEIASPKVSGVAQEEPPVSGVPRSANADDRFGQAAIADAIWASLHGDPSKVLVIVEELASLSAPQQAYLVSAWSHAQDAMVSLAAWRDQFHASRDERYRTASPGMRKLDHVAVATLEAAAQAQGDIPLIGDALRSLLEVAIEIREALLWETVTSYLNAGGTAAGLARVAMLAEEFPQISLPGYYLLDTYRDNGDVTHTFASEQDPSKLLSWQEDVIFEELTASQMQDYLQRCSDLSDDQEDVLDSSGASPEEQDLRGP